MNEAFVIEKQETIRQCCQVVCNNNSYVEDLAQCVSIWLLENKLPEEVKDGYLYMTAYNAYHRAGSEFRRLHIDTNIHHAKQIDSEQIGLNDVNNIDQQYSEVMKELTPIDKVWAEEIVKRNMSINLFSKHTGINRQEATERMKTIYKKLQDNART